MDKEMAGAGAVNQYAVFIEEAGGMVAIHNLQHHENLEIYKKCFYIMDKYFPEGAYSGFGRLTLNVLMLNCAQTRRRRPRATTHLPSMLQASMHSLPIVCLLLIVVLSFVNA